MAANKSNPTSTHTHHDGLQPSPSALEPTKIQLHACSSKKSYKGMWEEGVSFDLTQTHRNLSGSDWKTYKNIFDLGKSHKLKTPTNIAGTTQ
ncbi:hypothetical protein O181_019663 [Austropuccinia psidii MF-1]|uniref:Uncharacterized protein n=1 Tax=Austropuccinia psidii MF-1 TaxID=1389203 RepID=A0A9Q3GTT6_9BASI|nr:hypothetical protein [Austropuccinia psidii MF-1]